METARVGGHLRNVGVILNAIESSSDSPVAQILAVVVAIPFVVAGVLLSQTVRGIVKTSLYVYAREGKRPSQFDDQDFDDFGGQPGGSHPGQTGGGQSDGFV